MALDLNKPKDAKVYIESWIERGELRIGRQDLAAALEAGTRQDWIRLASQLFLYCDDRIPLQYAEGLH